jgi:hypothetical protein
LSDGGSSNGDQQGREGEFREGAHGFSP